MADTTVLAQFQTADGEKTGPPLSLPANVTAEQLTVLINKFLETDEPRPYSFYIDEHEVVRSIQTDIIDAAGKSTEDTLVIVYQPQAFFKVRAVTRCSSSLTGHTEAVLSASFSPDGSQLASGSGDTTVRIWDLSTETPRVTCKGHRNWVLCIGWSPNGRVLASGSMDNTVRLWDPETGRELGMLGGHRKWITALSWEPQHLNASCNRLASSSKDGTVRVWDTTLRRCVLTLSGHTAAVTCVKWGGDGRIYTGSQDKSIKIWNSDGTLHKTLSGHAHWVNTLAFSTDFALRTGAFDHTGKEPSSTDGAQRRAQERYTEASSRGVRLVSGSDDFTMHLWDLSVSSKPIARMTGHQKVVNHVSFSPDGRLIASASFDNSVKLWDGHTGKFIASLRGHVAAVYQVCWSADSRMMLSASKDSTLKIWDLRTKKLKLELPGHADEVFTVDWSPGGDRVVSGGKDRVLKIWKP
ncbi:ribosome assembly [Coemansia sp. RSA 1822]|nr:ribosome assembly [Coemansia sp. RSA 638]KAJ2125307.1 ribosome assembly [Coemansia sp. RSA 720]KAJ2482045.1 ribosome assembly [Coemansia sp. RSA 2131]KAJ2545663.1 ribosome assembly [Coemansia sp. RSA 1853]KAJ2561337.1 ribosome assembly [Coemansia sp. RSA 1822]KAJ2659715.1 ribosome assembly [Coemansia sp. RSA 1199]